LAVKPVKVAAGLVFKDEKLLIAKRLKNIHLGGMWEFPGGKLELGESYEICLKREMFEELGVKVNVSYEFEEVLHRYSEMTVLIKFFICSLSSGTPKAIQCSEFQWINRRDLTRYNFPAADIKVINQLRLNNNIWDK
jgi:8-oxo-dGTP diphosphatase